MWDSAKKQLAIGSVSELSGIKLNVEGGLRVGGQLVVGNSVLSLSEYVKLSQLHNVATSGKYSDLIGVPSLNLYVKQTELTTKLNNDHYKKADVNAEIDRRIGVFKTGVLQTEFSSKFSGFETGTQRDEKVTQALTDYYTKTAADTKFIEPSELTTALTPYATETKIKNTILSDYIKSNAVSQLGKSGLWSDILNKPELVTKNELETYKASVSNTYATKTLLNSELTSKIQAATASVLQKVNQDYVTKTELSNNGFAREASLNALKDVARTGQYADLTGRPNISGFMAQTAIESKFIDHSELTTSLSVYIKSSDVKTVGKTGQYADLEGEPDMSLFQKVSSMNIYITSANLANELQDVVRTGSQTSIDLTGYEKTADLTTKLSDYPKSNTLHLVATSGKFDDLIGTSNVITTATLSSQLGAYVTSSNLNDKITIIENKFYDATELLASFNAFRTEIATSRNTTLTNFYTKTAADAKIDEKLVTFKTNVMIPSMNGLLATKVSTSDLATTLANYKTSQNVVSYVSSQLGSYISTQNLKTELAYYSKIASVNGAQYLRFNTTNNVTSLRINGGPIFITGNIEAFSNLKVRSLEVDLGLESDSIKDETILAEDIKTGAVGSSEILDGTIVNTDINTNAAIAFDKLNISAANIRSENAYSAGTGVALNTAGQISIGQDVGTSATPTFSTLRILGKSGVSPSVTIEGTIKAGRFQGEGSELTNISASNISGQINASEVSGALIASQIAQDAIKAEHIQANAVDTPEIKNGAVTPEKLAAIPFTKISQTGANIRSKNPYTQGAGVTIDGNGQISIGQAVTQTSTPKFNGITIKPGASELMSNDASKINISDLNVSGKLTVGVSNPTHNLSVNGSVIATTFIGSGAGLTNVPKVPAGIIVMWSGAIDAIPHGWALCNGTQPSGLPTSTMTIPNLSSRFIVGYDANVTEYNQIGKTGGNKDITISNSNLPEHTHTGTIASKDTTHNHTGSSNNQNLQHRHHSSGSSGNQSHNHSHGMNGPGDHRHWMDGRPHDDNNNTGTNGTGQEHGLVADAGSYNQYADYSPGKWTTANGNHTHGIHNNNANHNHSISLHSDYQLGNHQHAITVNNKTFGHNHELTIDKTSNGTTAIDIRPPYFVLAFIIKLPDDYSH